MSLSRPFDYPERFEREKLTRIMPETLQLMGVYTLRMMMPPGKKPFATEFTTLVTDVELQSDHSHIVQWIWKFPKETSPEEGAGTFNARGFMIMDNSRRIYSDFPDEIEMGYFVGSIDAYDLALAELTADPDKALISLAERLPAA